METFFVCACFCIFFSGIFFSIGRWYGYREALDHARDLYYKGIELTCSMFAENGLYIAEEDHRALRENYKL